MGRPKNTHLKCAANYWQLWEERLDTIQAVEEWIEGADDFVWRGQVAAEWGMTTTLHRYLVNEGQKPNEPRQLEYVETACRRLCERVPWTGSDSNGLLHRLALLQHYGAASPLLDVTFDPQVALAFAVMPTRFLSVGSESDGRIFRFSVDNYDLVSDYEARTSTWETLTDPKLDAAGRPTRPVRLYRPSPLDPRMAAQSAAFIFGRFPDEGNFSPGLGRFPIDPGNRSYFSLEEHQMVWSQYLRVHKNSDRGVPAKHRIVTAKLPSALKPEIRDWLADKGWNLARLFPDLNGQVLWVDRDWPQAPTHVSAGS